MATKNNRRHSENQDYQTPPPPCRQKIRFNGVSQCSTLNSVVIIYKSIIITSKTTNSNETSDLHTFGLSWISQTSWRSRSRLILTKTKCNEIVLSHVRFEWIIWLESVRSRSCHISPSPLDPNSVSPCHTNRPYHLPQRNFARQMIKNQIQNLNKSEEGQLATGTIFPIQDTITSVTNMIYYMKSSEKQKHCRIKVYYTLCVIMTHDIHFCTYETWKIENDWQISLDSTAAARVAL